MNGTCGAGRSRRHRKLYGGMGYGFDGSTIGTAGAVYSNSWGGEVTKAGTPVTNADDPMRGSGRRRGGQMKFCEDGSAPNSDTGLCEDGSEPKTTAPTENTSSGAGRRKSRRKSKKGAKRHSRRRRGGVYSPEAAGGPSSAPTTSYPATLTPAEAARIQAVTAANDIRYGLQPQPQQQGRSRRKSKKGARRHRMRGGMSVAHSSAGFTGTGERGLANYQDVGGSQPFSNNVVPLS